jgi:hypothetical protein
MIFLLIFSALGVSIASMSGTNTQLAWNQKQLSRALSNAHSGLDVLRYHFQDVTVPASVAPADRLQHVASNLQAKFNDEGITNISVSYDSATQTITIPSVTLDSQSNQDFTATITFGADYDTLDLTVTGNSRQTNKKVAISYEFSTIGNPIFDWGIATRGPLNMQGNVDIDGFNENIEASVYIESLNSIFALDMSGKSSIAGKVSIANSAAVVDIASSSSVHGESGSSALQYVTVGADMCDFPTPNPAEFEGYIQSTFQTGDPTSGVTLKNIEIPANTNPSFSGNTTIRGIMYIRSPNTVSFTGNAAIHGLILAEGDWQNPDESCYLDFGGTVDSYDASTLPQEEFGSLLEHTGTFILAPGFRTNFRGDFGVVNGVIAASGIEFHGNAGGTINGSVINYSDEIMYLAGNTDLVFNRSGVEEVPAGFEPTKILTCITDSYSEPCN